MTTDRFDTIENETTCPAYGRVTAPAVSSIQDAARMLLEVASVPANDYEKQRKKSVINGVVKYVSGPENPAESLKELRNAIYVVGMQDGKAQDVIGKAKVLAFRTYFAAK